MLQYTLTTTYLVMLLNPMQANVLYAAKTLYNANCEFKNTTPCLSIRAQLVNSNNDS